MGRRWGSLRAALGRAGQAQGRLGPVPLRLKLLAAVIILVFAGLAVSDLVTFTSLKSFLLRRVDQQLEAAERPVALATLRQEEGPVGGFAGPHDASLLIPPGTYGEVRDAAGTVLGTPKVFTLGGTVPPPPALPATLPRPGAPPDRPDLFTTGAQGGSSLRYRVLVQRGVLEPSGQQVTLIVAIPLSEMGQTLHRLLLIELLVTVLVLVGLGLLSWWLVRRGLRPLEEIGETARAIAAGDLSRRVEPAEERTEVGRLGLALNAMLAQIEAAFEERRASEERLRRFVADASHELRTPLTSIRGYAELFRRGAQARPDDLAKSMQRIEAEASRMGVLVEDLLLLARLDQGRPLARDRVDLALVVSEAVDGARAADPGRPIRAEVPGPAEVEGDRDRLRQVVDNLLENARVHTPPATPVEVRVASGGGEVVLTVRDEGPGLSPEVAARAFERFYRGDPARSRASGGAGLGLSIVAAIVEAHGGRVRALPSDGRGAAFEVRLPARRSGGAVSAGPTT